MASFSGAAAAGHAVVWFLLPGAAAQGDTVPASFVALGEREQDPVDTIGRFREQARMIGTSGMMPYPPLFAASPQWDVGPGPSVVYSQGERFRLLRFAADRPNPFPIVVQVDPRPVTQADINAESARRLARVASSPPQMRAAFAATIKKAATEAPSHHPAIAAIRVLDDGTIWVREGAPPAADSAEYVVLGPDGSLIGVTTLPAHTRVMGGTMDRLLVVELDELDVPAARWATVER